MKVSMEQAKLAARQRQKQELTQASIYEKPIAASDDAKLLLKVREIINRTPDVRDELVAELKARIESGQYNPTGAEIADAMVRRTLADRIR